MRSVDRRLERILIGPKRVIMFDSSVHQKLIDFCFKSPLEVMRLQVHMIACKWVVSDDQSIRYPNELGNSLEISVNVSTPIAYD